MFLIIIPITPKSMLTAFGFDDWLDAAEYPLRTDDKLLLALEGREL